MKYIIDIDALSECLDCVDCIKVNGEIYIQRKLVQEFIRRFPKDTVAPENIDTPNN
jgi:hypothetical protein